MNRAPIAAQADANGYVSIGNQLQGPAQAWGLIYIAISATSGSPNWSVLAGVGPAATGAPLVYGAGAKAILGPFLLAPGERATIVVEGATAGAQILGQALGWQSDDPEELLSSTPITTAFATPQTPVPVTGSVSITGTPTVAISPGALVQLLAASGTQLLGDTSQGTQVADQVQETVTTTSTISSSQIVLASFKPSGGVPSLVAAGVWVIGTTTQVSPAWGAAPGAGHLLVALVTAYGNDPSTPAGWTAGPIANQAGGGTHLALFYKPNSSGGDAAPVFTAPPGGAANMQAVLLEFDKVATSNPLDKSASLFQASSGTSIAVQAAAVDGTPQDLVVWGVHWRAAPPQPAATATFGDSQNNSVTPQRAADNGNVVENDHSAANYGIIPALKSGLPLGVVPWPYDVTGLSTPATGSQATITLAAAPGFRYIAHHWAVSLANSAAAATIRDIQLQDASTSIWDVALGVAAAQTSTAHIEITGAAYPGTVGNSMTLKVDAAVAGLLERVNLAAYLL